MFTGNYADIKRNVLNLYSEFLSLINPLKKETQTTYDTALSGLKSKAEEISRDRFVLMVVGEAKSGKSSFINAFLGEEILPMGTKQCTSSIVEIRYGERFTLKVTYADNRIKIIDQREAIQKFLTDNAAVNDDYRDIPVSIINTELILRKKDKTILKDEFNALIELIKSAKPQHISESDYRKKVDQYIVKTKPNWRNIATKFEIEYPFENEDIRGFEIVDTPGVNAEGHVGDITHEYLGKANAIVFLKPLTGQAVDSTSFTNFINKYGTDKNKNLMLLLLTHYAEGTQNDNMNRVAEAQRLYININPEQILPIDSKAALFYSKFKNCSVEEIDVYIMREMAAGNIDASIGLAWFMAKGNQDMYGTRERFFENLDQISNFPVLEDTLNRFSRTAHFIFLDEFLELLIQTSVQILDNIHTDIELYRTKAESPVVLEEKINRILADLADTTAKMQRARDGISLNFTRSNGTIDTTVNTAIQEYKTYINGLSENASDSMDKLEKSTCEYVDKFHDYEVYLQKEVVKKCDQSLIQLSDKITIPYTTIKPFITIGEINKIKENRQAEANESYVYTTKKCVEKSHAGTRFSSAKHFALVRTDIISHLNIYANNAKVDLKNFAEKICHLYCTELQKNSKIKETELEKVKKEHLEALEIQREIEWRQALSRQFTDFEENAKRQKGEVSHYVK